MARLFKPTRKNVATTRESAPKSLEITGLSQEGRGVARHQGKAVFVSGALPGETVSVAHYRRQKRFSECVTKDVLQASPSRQTPFCPHYQQCGGCQLQHLEPSQQIELKQEQLLALLQRQYQLQPLKVLPAITSPDRGYRSRVRFGVDRLGQLAFRQQGSDTLIAIQQCEVLTLPLQNIMSPLQNWLNSLPERKGITHIECFMGDGLRPNGALETAVVVRHNKPLPLVIRQQLQAELTSTYCWFQGEKDALLLDADGNTIHQPELSLSLSLPSLALNEDLTLKYSPSHFTQVNREVNPRMIEQALEWLDLQKADRALDLFCGIGNFTLPMAKKADKVFGVEAVGSMVEQGVRNGARCGTGSVQFKCLDLESDALTAFMRQQAINKVLLDPPRSGAKLVCEQLMNSSVERLVYVSCNPASFARDAQLLARAGLIMAELRVLDMFPNTSHLETMALFVRKSGAKSR